MKPDEPQQGSADNWTFEDPPHPEPDMDTHYLRLSEQSHHQENNTNAVSNSVQQPN